MKHGLSIYSHRLSDGFNDGCNTHQAPDQRRPGNRNPCPKSWRSQILFSKVSEEPTKTPREKSACPFWKSGFFGSIASFEIQGGFGDVDTKQLATEHLWSVVQNHIIQTERWIQFHGVFWSFWPPNMACCLKIGGKPHTHTHVNAWSSCPSKWPQVQSQSPVEDTPPILRQQFLDDYIILDSCC